PAGPATAGISATPWPAGAARRPTRARGTDSGSCTRFATSWRCGPGPPAPSSGCTWGCELESGQRSTGVCYANVSRRRVHDRGDLRAGHRRCAGLLRAARVPGRVSPPDRELGVAGAAAGRAHGAADLYLAAARDARAAVAVLLLL